MFDPVHYLWHWITSSTPLTGGWVTVICLIIAVPIGFRQSVRVWKRDHEKIRRSGRPPGLHGRGFVSGKTPDSGSEERSKRREWP